MANETQKKQVAMHRNYFDRCQEAIDRGFYMEAVLLEYAAIESRLEALLGLLSAPCNRTAPDEIRRKVQISHRLTCAQHMYETTPISARSKLPCNFFEKVSKWVGKRNQYIHGLYKSENRYDSRIQGLKKIAEDGAAYSRLLYNEVKRLRRLLAKQNRRLYDVTVCNAKNCQLYQDNVTNGGEKNV